MPPRRYKILFVSSEVMPFVKTGGLADVSSALPQYLSDMGHEVRIVLPKYGAIDQRKFKIHEVVRLKDIQIKIGDKDVVFSLKSCFLPGPKVRVQIYFLENQEYFGSRNSLYVDSKTEKDYPDNDERFILLARSVPELITRLGWIPDIIHCNDWQCGLIPAYLKTINTVSETYANEICTDEKLGSGLKSVLAKRKNDLFGIVTGIDMHVWNPEKDKHIIKKYSLKDIELKAENKIELANKFGFDYDPQIPIAGVISRLYNSKGMDLITDSFKEIMSMKLQLILLGTGDRKYHNFFEKMSEKYKQKFACYLGFNDELAHFIEAGADIFLMPSLVEPCGLNQMYSLVYGTIPIVRETGGLADTVIRYDEKTEEGNGFVFKKYDTDSMLKELKRALKLFEDKKKWTKIMRNGMKIDFSWNASAKKYVDLYKTILEN